METVLIKTLQLFLSLSLLVFIHEMGHFLFSRLFKVRVEKFYIFFNPWFSLFKYQSKRSGTVYGLGWVPLGGYCKIAGMIDESMDKEAMALPAQPDEFRSKKVFPRFMIMVGGVLFNFILALIIYSAVLFTWGESYTTPKNVALGMDYSAPAKSMGCVDGDILLRADDIAIERYDESTIRIIAAAKTVYVQREAQEVAIAVPDTFMTTLIGARQGFASFRMPMVVNKTMPGTAAETAGLTAGDSIVGINGEKLLTADRIAMALSQNAGKPISLEYYRYGTPDTMQITPSNEGKLGIELKPFAEIYPPTQQEYTLLGSIPAGITKGVETLKGYVGDFEYVFTKEGAKSLGGFAAIGSIFPETFNWMRFWEMTAFLSIILAFMNILPIPALDGGHILFLLWEMITGRKPSDKFLEYAQTAGMIILLALMLFANGNDLFRFVFN